MAVYIVLYVCAVDLVQHTDRTDRKTPEGRRGDGVGEEVGLAVWLAV